jgi:hypothetical protein
MAAKCSVCVHSNRAEIELALARRLGLKTLAKRYGLSPPALSRHTKNHMPPQLKKTLAATARRPSELDLDNLRKDESEGLLQTALNLRARMYSQLDQAEEQGDLRAAASLDDRILDSLTFTAKLLGDLSTHSQTTINQLVVSPQYLELRSALIRALQPFPDARKAVSRVLRGLEGGRAELPRHPRDEGRCRGCRAVTGLLSHDLLRALDPIEFALDCGMELDDWQQDLLYSTFKKQLLLCSRQSGKSTITAMLALWTAIHDSGLILLFSPSQRQSSELFRKVLDHLRQLRDPPEISVQSALRLELANGSRIVSLPANEDTIRGYSGARLIVIDEAARVPDSLMAAVRPILATSGGRLIALSTPAGKRGWSYEAWMKGVGWSRIKITASQCPRITKAFLDDELAELGPVKYSEEYECQFHDDEMAAFAMDLIENAFRNSYPPLWAT